MRSTAVERMRHTRRRDLTVEVEYCHSLVMTVMEITGICDPNISVYSGFRLISGILGMWGFSECGNLPK